METYKQVNDYLLFKELFSDSLGRTYRGGELAGKQVSAHKIVTLVHSFYLQDERTWNRINILLEGIRKSNIPHLFSPEKIIKEDQQAVLAFRMLKARTFEQMIEDAEKKDNPINFDLAFSTALQIAELIDIGSSIVVSGKKSFHGFLTPDNILIDHDGNILLKNYGITPYIDSNDEVFTELEKKYGAWLTPEFLRREKIVPQSDIYHLGYLLYRMLTGKYFFYTEGEDFDAKFANLSFSQHIPSTDKDFLTNIIGFFKKTLNPDPGQRFASIKELKDYVSNTFHIEELSSVTFNLAYFMNSLYSEAVEEEDREMARELDYVIPEEEEEIAEAPAPETAASGDDRIVESILTGLDEKDKSGSRFLIPAIIAAVLVVVVGVAVFLVISQNKKAEQIRLEALREQQRLEQRQVEMQQEFQNRLKALQEQTTTTEAEEQAKEEKIRELEEWKLEQERKLRAQMQAEEEARKQKELEKQRKAEEERKRREEEERKRRELEAKKQQEALEQKKREEEMKQIKEGDIVALNMVTQKPQKVEGRNPRFNSAIRKKYKDQQMTVLVSMLIDETGQVSKVKVLGNVPADIKLAIVSDLADWVYTPAKKDDIRVKVWIQVPIKIEF